MRKISLALVAAMFLATGGILAKTPKATDPAKKLQKQVMHLLSGFDEMPSTKDVTALILFTVNKEKEFVVLSVDSDNEEFKNFVKTRLNYNKIQLSDIPEGRRYTVPVKIIS